jgi:hypothetical protein
MQRRNMTITIREISDKNVMYSVGRFRRRPFCYVIPDVPEVKTLVKTLEPGNMHNVQTIRLHSTWLWTGAVQVVDPIKSKLTELVQVVDDLAVLLDDCF